MANLHFYRALIVDDDPISLSMTTNALSHEGFLCSEATDGMDALSRFTGRFDVVVTDLLMPNVHGHALVVELLQRSPRPLIVALTSVREPRLVTDLMVRGIDDIFFKPVDYPAFAMKLRAAVIRRQKAAGGGPETDAGIEEATDMADADAPAM